MPTGDFDYEIKKPEPFLSGTSVYNGPLASGTTFTFGSAPNPYAVNTECGNCGDIKAFLSIPFGVSLEDFPCLVCGNKRLSRKA